MLQTMHGTMHRTELHWLAEHSTCRMWWYATEPELLRYCTELCLAVCVEKHNCPARAQGCTAGLLSASDLGLAASDQTQGGLP